MNYIDHTDGIKRLSQLFAEKQLIPVFGAGFTKGSKAKMGNVPDGSAAARRMYDIVRRYMDVAEMQEPDFRKMSKLFRKGMNNNAIPEREYKNFFENNFTEVYISSSKVDFLKLDWPFAFTINVDDGIERNSDFSAVMPFHVFRGNERNKKYLYKLHGDAGRESTYQETNIVFDEDQYLQAITDEDNKAMRESLSSAYKEFDLLYIGCSLKEETDLKYIYNSVKFDRFNVSDYILKTEKLTDEEEEHLSDSYGITDIILVKDYERFYLDFIESVYDLPEEEYKFTNPSIESVSDKDMVYFSGYKSFDEKHNKFMKSSLLIKREQFRDIQQSIEETTITIISGRRFSGRTSLLLQLCEHEKNRKVLFFPSTTQEDIESISNIIRNNQNTLMLFDSNSLGQDGKSMIRDLGSILVENGNRIVIATGIGADGRYFDSGIQEFELSNKFTKREINELNIKIQKYGYIKRAFNETNLDYLFSVEKEQKRKISLPVNLPKSYTKSEQILILLLYVGDKIYSKDIYSLKIKDREVMSFIERVGKVIVEWLPNNSGRRKTYSTRRLVHNSRKILLSQLSAIDFDDVVDDIKKIVEAFKGSHYEQRVIYREVMKFDSLNEMFGRKKGAGNLIDKVYAELEELLSDDLHFWLQRSKSLYRRFPNDYEKLKDAYRYVKKAYIDAAEDSTVKMQSAVSASLVCGLLYSIEHDREEKKEYLVEAINLGFEARMSRYFNTESYGRRKRYIELIWRCCSLYITEYENEGKTASNAFDIMRGIEEEKRIEQERGGMRKTSNEASANGRKI
ncbi:MAG: SIR2 family protein [Lachnospiraceae bacterium]|nr:SIR2 family protein [Lachnospiraceae bacterium]